MSNKVPNVEAPLDLPAQSVAVNSWSDRAFGTVQYSLKGTILGSIMVLGVSALLGDGHWPTIGAILIIATYSNGFVSKL
ncbi:MAG: hypothetical protein AAGD04_06125 [Pseudomonadota bacterium]